MLERSVGSTSRRCGEPDVDMGRTLILSTITVDMRSREQVERHVRLAAQPVPSELWVALQEQGLICADVPLNA